ncbi:MAG TPA: TatD family hydrolase [Pseudomonadales bacterium]
MLVDSHCHLNYLEDPERRLADARRRGVTAFLCIGVDESGIGDVLALAERHDDVWATVGQHPEAAAADPGWILERLGHPRVVAMGEMGLDYFHETDDAARRRQRERFAWQLGAAGERRLPVVIHTRAAEADTLDLLRAHRDVTGVLHCFTESWEMAAAALELGYYVSISGIVTFRNAGNVREVARRVPADRLLVETDSPWLAPVPHRGKPNEPAYVADTAAFLAELRGVTPDALAETTTANFRRLFSV